MQTGPEFDIGQAVTGRFLEVMLPVSPTGGAALLDAPTVRAALVLGRVLQWGRLVGPLSGAPPYNSAASLGRHRVNPAGQLFRRWLSPADEGEPVTTKVEKSILVNVPVSTAYNQWTQFEDFPQFMNGITKVTHVSDDTLQWVAQIAGVKRQWEAKILQQVPDQKVAWAATSGATNAGEVTFQDVGGGQTSVHLSLEYEPEGIVEKVGDKLNVVESQAEGDLERFKKFIEAEGYATGAWRGTVNPDAQVSTPGVEHAAASSGDSGKAGVSCKAGVEVVGVAAAAGIAARRSHQNRRRQAGTTCPSGAHRLTRGHARANHAGGHRGRRTGQPTRLRHFQPGTLFD